MDDLTEPSFVVLFLMPAMVLVVAIGFIVGAMWSVRCVRTVMAGIQENRAIDSADCDMSVA